MGLRLHPSLRGEGLVAIADGRYGTREPVHLGETLREDLEAIGMSASEFARWIEDQLRVCREHAEREGWRIAGAYRDAAVSGASTLVQAIAAAQITSRGPFGGPAKPTVVRAKVRQREPAQGMRKAPGMLPRRACRQSGPAPG